MLRGQRAEHRELVSSDKRKVWIKALKWASSSLEGIKHTFVKNLTNPPLFSDIDILVPYEEERERALEALGGKERFSHGAFLEGSGRFILRMGNLDLDIYPDACWGGFKVADGQEIVGRRIQARPFGVKLEVPSPDDSFYLIATHAYSHLNIRRVELENCRHLSLDPLFDIGRVEELASHYGTKQAISIFCDILNIDTKLECRYDFIDDRPDVKIPVSFVLRSSFDHAHSLSGRASMREFLADVGWHLVRPMTKLMGER